jgi:hypothetical protein
MIRGKSAKDHLCEKKAMVTVSKKAPVGIEKEIPVGIEKVIPVENKKKLVECATNNYLDILEPPLSNEDKEIIMKTIKKFLADAEIAKFGEDKAHICLKLFTYLTEPKCCKFMKDSEKFKQAVLHKLVSLKYDFKRLFPKYNAHFEILSKTIVRRIGK